MKELLGFMGNAFFGLMAVIFPMIYSIIVGNKLIASQVDRGSMAYVLSTPTKRNDVTLTQAFYLIGSLLIMFITLSALWITAASVLQPGALDTKHN